MKECKILHFPHPSNNRNSRFVGVRAGEQNPGAVPNGGLWNVQLEAMDYPPIEKFLAQYLNKGFVVKNMTGDSTHGYVFYLERNI